VCLQAGREVQLRRFGRARHASAHFASAAFRALAGRADFPLPAIEQRWCLGCQSISSKIGRPADQLIVDDVAELVQPCDRTLVCALRSHAFQLAIEPPTLLPKVVEKAIRHGSAGPSVEVAQGSHDIVVREWSIDTGWLAKRRLVFDRVRIRRPGREDGALYFGLELRMADDVKGITKMVEGHGFSSFLDILWC
jgi:hypothetical protein